MIATDEKRIADPSETERLLGEVERYLRVVDAYRQEGYEPRWLPEPPPTQRV